MSALRDISPIVRAGINTSPVTPILMQFNCNDIKILPQKFKGCRDEQTQKQIDELKQTIWRLEKDIEAIELEFPIYKEDGERVETDKEKKLKKYKKELFALVYPNNYNISESNEKGRTYNGRISQQTGRKMKRYLNGWTSSIKVATNKEGAIDPFLNLKFVTLTLPAAQKYDACYIENQEPDYRNSDLELKRVFTDKFIKTLQRKFSVDLYFWRCEPQKNGNIHFHLLIDKFIHYKSIQHIWNNICLKPLGYLKDYKEEQEKKHKNGFKFDKELFRQYNISQEVQFSRYEKGVKCGWSKPNTTDIHQVEKVENIEAYLMKYMIKNDAERVLEREYKRKKQDVRAEDREKAIEGIRPINGRLWGCSDKLRKLSKCEIKVDNEVSDYIESIVKDKDRQTKVFDYDYATIIQVNNIKEVMHDSAVGAYFQHVNYFNFYQLYCSKEIKPVDIPSFLIVPNPPNVSKDHIAYKNWLLTKRDYEKQNKKLQKRYKSDLKKYDNQKRRKRKYFDLIPSFIKQTFEFGLLSYREFIEIYNKELNELRLKAA